MKVNQDRLAQEPIQTSQKEQLEYLTLFYTALRQELISRTLQSLSSDEIEVLSTDIDRQIEKLGGKEK
jgi:hypothetical protein